jgi:uncharacterized membrane protein (UPF0127 family)
LAQARGLVTFEKSALAIKTKTGQHDFKIEIARRPRQQAQGLMFRRKLAANAGMLFLYRNAKPAQMWMKNTNIPLDLLFLNGLGKIVGFHQRSVPHSLEVISSKQPISAVLEVNAGTVSRLQIEVGDKVVHREFQTK